MELLLLCVWQALVHAQRPVHECQELAVIHVVLQHMSAHTRGVAAGEMPALRLLSMAATIG